MNAACGLLLVDPDLRVLTADRFFLEALGALDADPCGRPLAEVLGRARGRDPLPALADRENRNGSLETVRRAPGAQAERRLRVSYARTRLENDESAILLTVEAVQPESPRRASRRRGG